MVKKLESQQKFTLGEIELDLDAKNLKFNESNLNQYYQEESGNYDYYSAQLVYADYLLAQRELAYDDIYNSKFVENKDAGGSDRYVEAKTKADEEVIARRNDVIMAKYKKNLLQQYIKAWDKNHENALNLGHHLRKEMEKLGFEIKTSQSTFTPEELSNFPDELNPEDLK